MNRYMTSDPKYYKELKERRKYLILNQTETENIIWNKLRNRKIGYKFRRQHIIENYIVDFVCLERNLIIEIDGSIHNLKSGYDSQRSNDLEYLSYKLVRFTNQEVLDQSEKVLGKIKLWLE